MLRNCQITQKNKKLQKNKITGGVFVGDEACVNVGDNIVVPNISSDICISRGAVKINKRKPIKN